MRAKNEVTVDRLELKQATGWTRRGKIGARDKTYLLFEDGSFTVVAPAATTTIKSVGRWEGEVSVAAIALKRLVATLPAEREVKVAYFDGWLLVGEKNKLSATNSFMEQAMPPAPQPPPELPLFRWASSRP
jgi:hypothetical protein